MRRIVSAIATAVILVAQTSTAFAADPTGGGASANGATASAGNGGGPPCSDRHREPRGRWQWAVPGRPDRYMGSDGGHAARATRRRRRYPGCLEHHDSVVLQRGVRHPSRRATACRGSGQPGTASPRGGVIGAVQTARRYDVAAAGPGGGELPDLPVAELGFLDGDGDGSGGRSHFNGNYCSGIGHLVDGRRGHRDLRRSGGAVQPGAAICITTAAAVWLHVPPVVGKPTRRGLPGNSNGPLQRHLDGQRSCGWREPRTDRPEHYATRDRRRNPGFEPVSRRLVAADRPGLSPGDPSFCYFSGPYTAGATRPSGTR